MRLEKASLKNASAIAAIYVKAFPESVGYFFPKKETKKLLKLLELAFMLVFLWGGQGLMLLNEKGETCGYCLYISKKQRRKKNYLKLAATALQLLTKINFKEAALLIGNSMKTIFCTKHNQQVPSPQAEIFSIAVNPAYQGRGLGTELLNTVLVKLKNQSITLNVRKVNYSGRRLYKSAGFIVFGQTKDLLGEWLMLFKHPSRSPN